MSISLLPSGIVDGDTGGDKRDKEEFGEETVIVGCLSVLANPLADHEVNESCLTIWTIGLNIFSKITCAIR